VGQRASDLKPFPSFWIRRSTLDTVADGDVICSSSGHRRKRRGLLMARWDRSGHGASLWRPAGDSMRDVDRQFVLDDPDVALDRFGRVGGKTQDMAGVGEGITHAGRSRNGYTPQTHLFYCPP
jgi:hypothetical protein